MRAVIPALTANQKKRSFVAIGTANKEAVYTRKTSMTAKKLPKLMAFFS